MPRTLILGSGGRLGSALLREWGAVGEDVFGLTRAQLDITNEGLLRSTLEGLDFDVLVNCAAQTNVDYCETHKDEAYSANATAVGVIGEVCARRNARCIHISTDYVFDGAASSPYREEDRADPISVYGQSKRDGELALLNAADTHLVVRVSWVFGPDRPSFVDQVLTRALEQETAAAVADKWAVPTFTLDAAALLRPLLRDVRAGGILHLCNAGGCTWQEYGQHAINVAASLGVPLKARHVAPLRMSDLTAFIAKRPPYTILSHEKLASLIGLEPRSWQDAVADHVRRQITAGALPLESHGA